MDGNFKNQNISIQELREIVVEDLLEEDEYYQAISTPIKSASACKKEHQDSLREAVKLEKLQKDLNEAIEILIKQMPSFVGEVMWKEMLAECAELNFSEKTLAQIYKLGRTLLEKKCFNEASPIFLFMVYLNPNVPDYWLGIGIALYSSQKFEEALAFLKIAVILQPIKAAPLIYTTLCYTKLKNYELAKVSLEKIFEKSLDERNMWSNEIDFIQKHLKKVQGG